MKLLNAFSINMLTQDCSISFARITADEAKLALQAGFDSAVGHQSTADLLSAVLGLNVNVNRVNVELNSGEQAIVAQYRGPRLEEGATELPEGATIEYWIITVQ